MKRSFKTFGLLAVAALAAGCSNISEDDRYISIEKPVQDNPRTLLAMEFTGVSCRNCPNGAAAMTDIMKDEPGKVIVVGLHPYDDVNTTPILDTDLRCDEATVMYKYYKPAGFPCAVFDGLTKSTAYGEWMTLASNALTVPSKMTIDAKCSYNSASRSLEVDYEINFTNNISDPLSVMVWLVESGISGWQNDNGKLVMNYTHNHVLRASLNGDWGEKIGARFGAEDVVKGSAHIDLDQKWVPENCQVVVYVFRDSDKGVEQAAEAEVVDLSLPD